MKGNINISIEVDLSHVICDDSLEALMLFTGRDSKEGVATFYLENIAKTITSLEALSKPNIKYSVSGNIMQEPVEKAVNVDDFSMVDVAESEEIVEHEESDKNLLIDSVIEFMEKVSIEKGLPKEIHISAEHYDLSCIKDGVGMSFIAGLPVIRDTELETSIARIDYSPYFDTDIIESAYLTSLGNII